MVAYSFLEPGKKNNIGNFVFWDCGLKTFVNIQKLTYSPLINLQKNTYLKRIKYTVDVSSKKTSYILLRYVTWKKNTNELNSVAESICEKKILMNNCSAAFYKHIKHISISFFFEK